MSRQQCLPATNHGNLCTISRAFIVERIKSCKLFSDLDMSPQHAHIYTRTLSNCNFRNFYHLSVCILLEFMYVYYMQTWYSWSPGEGVWTSETGVTGMVSHHGSARNGTCVLWKSSQCSSQLSQHSSPGSIFLICWCRIFFFSLNL